MAARQPDVEILVHINAPSRAADDAHYRQLAEAYLDFEPSCVTALPSLQEHELHERTESVNQSGPSPSPSHVQQPALASSSQEYATPAPIPAFFDSQDLSFQSALDNRESPRLGDTTIGINLDATSSPTHDDGIGTQESWRAPPSEIADSFPMPDPSLLRGSPSKVLERYLCSSTSIKYSAAPGSTPKQLERRASQSGEHVEVPSSPPQRPAEVPSSPSSQIPPPAILSSPLPIVRRPEIVPVSSESGEAEPAHLIPTSDDALDVTHISSSPIMNGAKPLPSQIETPSHTSEDILDITHVTGSPIESKSVKGSNQSKERASAGACASDKRTNVTHTSISVEEDISEVVPSQQQYHSAVPEDPLDVTHISMSSVGGSPVAEQSQKRELPPEGGSNLDVTHISSSSFELSGVQARARSPPVSKRRRHSQSASPSPTLSAGATNFISPSLNALTAGPQPDTALSLEIMPPSPPSGLRAVIPDDLIPPQLAKLANDLSSRYRPSPPTRDIDALERGYWLLDCDAWPAATRDSTWAFLTRYVRSGLAGWGVWCRREEEPHRFLRLYCWGHVVKHAYLLLYLASERKLKGTGGVWIDADGKVVINVPPYGK